MCQTFGIRTGVTNRSGLRERAMLGGECAWVPQSRFRGVIFGLMLLAISAMGGAVEAPDSDPMTHLVGTVLDANGTPAAGALVGILANHEVRLMQVRDNRLYVKADTAGQFDLAIPRSLGTATVVARRVGSVSVRSGSLMRPRLISILPNP
jgi:hypothetical protein